MNRRQPFSAAEYLCRYCEIVDKMAQGMYGAKLTGSISHNFIAQMIPHHRAAIEMSENLLKVSDFAPLQRIAERIVEEQTRSIENMQTVLPQCEKLSNTPQDLCRYQKEFCRITGAMIWRMRNACADRNINGNFMREMIPHHQGAIQMSRNALQYPICPELVPILQAIITSQEQGVREMEELLRQIYC